MQNQTLLVNTSPLALLSAVEINTTAYLPCDRAEWDEDNITLAVRPLDESDKSFMSSLQTSSTLIVAHDHNVALCSLKKIKALFVAGTGSSWEVHLSRRRRDFSPSWEMSFAGTSADKLAELRARRLLLNESPARESRDINEITRELFIGGQETLIRIERSPFPELYRAYRTNPETFLHAAWINAVMQLILSATVAEVQKLELSLNGPILSVVFRGKRRQQYQNVPAYEISVSGRLALPSDPWNAETHNK